MLLDQSRPAPPRQAVCNLAGRRQSQLLTALHDLAQGRAQFISHVERSWASATFAGTRHSLTLTFCGSEGVTAGEGFIARLPEHEFTLPGQLVADAAVTAVDHQLLPSQRITVSVEMLLLQDA